MKEIDCM